MQLDDFEIGMRWFSTVFTLESGSNAVAVKGETFLVAHGQRPHFLNVPDISQTLFLIFYNILSMMILLLFLSLMMLVTRERERGEEEGIVGAISHSPRDFW